MDEPIWILWVAGVGAIVGGVLLFKYRDQAYNVIHRSNPLFRGDPKDSFGDGSFLFLPAIFAPLIGIFFLFFVASRTFGWDLF